MFGVKVGINSLTGSMWILAFGLKVGLVRDKGGNFRVINSIFLEFYDPNKVFPNLALL